MAKISRAKIARYFADEILDGKPDVIGRLSALLLEDGRTHEIGLVAADIEYELSKRGLIVADVTSATPLDEGFEEAVRQVVAAAKDDKVILREHVDPSIIGGIKIGARGKEFDATVRHRLNTLRATKA